MPDENLELQSSVPVSDMCLCFELFRKCSVGP